MAKENKAIAKANRNIQNISKAISANMDTLHRATYMSSPQHGKDIQNLNDKINSNIDNITNKNIETFGIPTVSKLYSRIIDANKGDKSIADNLENMFDNGLVTDDLYGLFMSNRYLKDYDTEIDTVCKYMPKLEEALQVQKDCVLSADHFSKDFLNLIYPISGQASSIFAERAKDMKNKYELQRRADEIYEDTSKYGEVFIYRVPYATAIGKLLSSKPDGTLVAPNRGMNESSYNDEESSNELFNVVLTHESINITSENSGECLVHESSVFNKVINKRTPDGNSVTRRVEPILGKNETFKINLEICKNYILESAVKEYQYAIKKKESFSENSMASIHEANNTNIEAKGNIDIGKNPFNSRMIVNDGLVIGDKPKNVKVTIPGCVIKRIPRETVVPIYIDDICMGYYVFEFRTNTPADNFMGFKNILGDPLTNMRGDGRNNINAVDMERQDQTIRYVAGQLSSFIDKQFVNNNQDLAKEIYMILKYNDIFNTPSIDTIKVTFVPPEDMVHFFFRQDPITHRGISDLDKGLIPAKIYSSLYITSAIGNLTRSQDKRVYYVKQTVDTNIAQTLLNTIAQIKQSNFGIRQFQNINNILNITGRFNDFVIPTNASGDPPINFEIMPGQEIQAPIELMETLEEMAINSTNIPIEIIQARQSIDYAMQLTMSSSKVLRFCYKRQELYEAKLTEFICPIYNYEYGDNTEIEVRLPPPSFINITNTNQLIDNTKTFVQSIVDIEMASEEDEKLKANYSNELFKHYIGTHLDISAHKDILNRCKIETASEKDESHSDGGMDGGY